MTPNQRKYFDESKGCTLNAECKDCKAPIWAQEGIQTLYEGKMYLHNTQEKVIMSVNTLDGLVCLTCWESRNGNTKSKDGLRPYQAKSATKREAVRS